MRATRNLKVRLNSWGEIDLQIFFSRPDGLSMTGLLNILLKNEHKHRKNLFWKDKNFFKNFSQPQQKFRPHLCLVLPDPLISYQNPGVGLDIDKVGFCVWCC